VAHETKKRKYRRRKYSPFIYNDASACNNQIEPI